MLSNMLRDLIKRLAAHDPDGNGFPVIQGKLFRVSWHRYLLTSEQLQTIQYVLRYVLQYVFQYDIIERIGKIIFVVCAFEDHGVIKLISARPASAPEKERYELGEDVF